MERMDGGMQVASVVEIVAGSEAATHHLVALIYDTLGEVATEPTVKKTVATVELTLNRDRVVGQFCILV